MKGGKVGLTFVELDGLIALMTYLGIIVIRREKGRVGLTLVELGGIIALMTYLGVIVTRGS